MTLLEGIFAIGLGRRWAAMSAAFLAGLFTLLLIAAPAPASDSGALSGDELVGHDPRTGVWTMPDGRTFYYGDPADQPIMCDWDGDGIDTVGLYRSSTGFLHLRHTNDQGFSDIQIFYGIPEDQPVCGDWDGDGVHTIGIYRPSEQRFYLRNTNTQGFADFFFDFAFAGVPIAGDWDGDGIDTVGTYDPATGRVALSRDNSSTVEDLTYFGQAGDTVVTGDWENSGADRLGVVRGESTILSLRSGVVQLDSTPAGTPVAARVTARDPNGVILLDSDTYQQGSIVPVATDISVGATGLVNVTSPAGATSVLYGANLGPLDELGVWTLELTAADQAGNLDPTPAVATLQVVPAAPPVITGLNPAWTVRQGDFLDVSASAQGQGPFAYEWTFGPGMPGAAVADPEPIPITGADSFTGTIEVTDRFGRSSTASFAVAVLPNQPPDGSIESPVAAVAIPSGASISFTGAATDPDGDSVTLSWDFGNSGNASVAGAETGDIFFNSPGEFVVT